METFKKTSIGLLIAVLMVSSVLATTIMYQISITSNMKLKATYGIGLYYHGTTDPISSYDFGDFADGETKEYVFDMVNTGNVPMIASWNKALSPLWSLEVWEKNSDASTYTIWNENEQIAGIGVGHIKNIKFVLTEVNANVDEQYSFTVTFYSVT
jgi:hypothetical protein